MARKTHRKSRQSRFSPLEKQAASLEAEKRWLALRGLCLKASREETEPDIAVSYRMRAATANAHFEVDCAATSQIVHTPTPRRCPFRGYHAGFNTKGGFCWNSRMRAGVQRVCNEAIEKAKGFKQPVVVTGITLGNERHTVLEVNEHGEVTFQHPQFKARLSESGGVA